MEEIELPNTRSWSQEVNLQSWFCSLYLLLNILPPKLWAAALTWNHAVCSAATLCPQSTLTLLLNIGEIISLRVMDNNDTYMYKSLWYYHVLALRGNINDMIDS